MPLEMRGASQLAGSPRTALPIRYLSSQMSVKESPKR